MKAHFEHFWPQLAKWLSGSLWRLILSISGACWPNGSQERSGSSFWAFLDPAGQIALRKLLKAHFGHIYGRCATWDFIWEALERRIYAYLRYSRSLFLVE